MKSKIKKIVIYALILAIVYSCKNHTEKTKEYKKEIKKSLVKNFIYGGYGDNVDGIIEAEIFTIENGKEIPISDTMTLYVGNERKKIRTDNVGYVSVYVKNGVYNLKLVKENYQPLEIRNYISHDDQVTQIKVILGKGNEIQIFNCPKWIE